MGPVFLDPVFKSLFAGSGVIEAAPVAYTQDKPDPCGRNVPVQFEGLRPTTLGQNQACGAGAIWPRISRTGSRWAAVMAGGALCDRTSTAE